MNKNRIRGTETEMRRPTALKSDTYTDGLYVYAAVISVEVRVHYPGCKSKRRIINSERLASVKGLSNSTSQRNQTGHGRREVNRHPKTHRNYRR